MCIVDRTIIRNIWKLRMGLCSMQERASREGVLPFPSVYPCGEKTPTMSGGSVTCIVDRTIIRNIWKLRMGLSVKQSSCSIPSFYPSPVRISMARRLPDTMGNDWESSRHADRCFGGNWRLP